MKNWSNLVFFWIAVFVFIVYAFSTSDARYLKRPTFKQARAIRGFKSMPLNVGRGFGKRTNEQDFISEPDENGFIDDIDGITESFPIDWLADKMEKNPSFAKTVLRKFVDSNGDGQLTLDELLRPPY